MKRTIEFLGWSSVVVTIFALCSTLVTTYHFITLRYFMSYKVFQECIVVTMFIWSFKLYGTGKGKRKWIYSMICVLFAAATVYFMQNDVW